MASAPPKLGGDSMGWVGPAIMGGASLGGAALGGKAEKKAAQIQAQTADKALAFARDQEAYKRQSYEQAMDAYRQQYNAAQARRDALLASYGFDVPSTGNLTLTTPAPGSSTAATGTDGAQVPSIMGIPFQLKAQAGQDTSGGIRDLMSRAAQPKNPSVDELGDAFRGPWGGRNWAE